MVRKVVKARSSGEFSALALNKLESSGITPEQATLLGMSSVDDSTTKCDYFAPRPGLVIPYTNIDGSPMRAGANWPEFYRLRYLGDDKSFKATTESKEERYVQPANTGICAYFPPVLDWQKLAKSTEPLLITEGEFKSAKACLEGFPTIGLGGVYNFRSAKHGVFFLPELEQFKWARRPVTIVYDSDYQENPNICAAINVLAEELQERGALVSVGLLEPVYDDPKRKTGLDDFLIEKGDDALIEVIDKAEPLLMCKHLWGMNDEVLYIRDPGFIVVQASGQKLPVNNFTAHSDWSTASVPERKMMGNGTVSVLKASAAAVWLKWPLRAAVTAVTYAPGQERLFDEDGRSFYNQWKGWGVQPKRGSVKPFLELFDFITHGLEKEYKEWLLDWMAYPIIHPGTKLFTAVVMHGRATGTGKTLIGYTLGRIYGENFTKIKNEDLNQTWWAENRQFVLGDEISGTDKRSEADAMKTMITQEELNINIKFIPQFKIPDCINYYLTSNHCNALFLEDEDRRYLVHEVQQTKPLPDEFYAMYDKWLKQEDGASYLMDWLLKRDVSKFNPKGRAPRTAARERMIIAGKSDMGLWCRELREQPGVKLRAGKLRHQRDLFTSKELLELYHMEHGDSNRATANGLARVLKEAGFINAYNGNPIPTKDGKQGRYFIIRNAEKWERAPLKALVANIALMPVA